MELKLYSLISPARQKLVKTIQSLGFGVIDLEIANGEPCVLPPPKILQDIKIGGDSLCRTESLERDFVLTSRMLELFEHLDRLRHGKIKIEVKHSQPFRLTVEHTSEIIDGRSGAPLS